MGFPYNYPHLNPQFIEVEKNRRLVVLTEEEYDKLLDVIDNIVAQRIEADESDPVLSWEEFSRKLVKKRKRGRKRKN